MTTVWLSHARLSVDAVVDAVAHPGAGAVTTFLGLVRDQNEGHAVSRLDYSAYEPMALSEMQRIVDALCAERPGVKVAVAHRLGELAVGDLAVVCAASAKHRPDAFWASREAIDRIKATVPIWKREHGPDGATWVGWVDARCTPDGHAHGPHGHAHGPHGHAHGPHGHAHGGRPHDPHGPTASAEAADPHTRRAEADPSAARAIRVVTITVSDTRTADDDRSGRALAAALASFHCVRHAIVHDDAEAIRAEVLRAIEGDRAFAVVLTGGTGVAPRDVTVEAIAPLFGKTLDGFGEAFRRLSWDEIGPRAVLSRATAGVVAGALVFALPGSEKGARLGAERLVAPILLHGTELLAGGAPR